MNVLIIANYRTPNSGNFIASLLELGQLMRQNGDDVVFLFPERRNGGEYSWSAWLKAEGFQVFFLNEGLPAEEVLEELKRIIQKHYIRLVHSHFGLYHGLLIKSGKKLGVKVLFHDHMDYVTDANETKQRLYTIRNALAYAVTGTGVISVMEKKHRDYWYCSKRWYIPNGLSLLRDVEEELSGVERREKLNISAEDKLCLFLGWDMYRKGLDIAVKAVAVLRQKDPTWQLGLVGFGDAPSESALNWIREKTGIDPQVPWIRFFASTEDMYSYHRAADVYLSASRAEAFSYGILEAISQNTPVAVSDIEGTSWAKAYNKCVIFPTENCEECAAAVHKAYILGNGESNRDELLKQYGIDLWCSRIMAVYHAMLRGN